MARMSLAELDYLFSVQDKTGVLLVVEGTRDSRFFQYLVPLAERANASVMPISEIEIPVPVAGGDRGRALWLSSHLAGEGRIDDRVHFFLDSDLDRLSGGHQLGTIIYTDFSDFEAYVLNECSLSHILYTFGRDPAGWSVLGDVAIALCRPIKEIRVASRRCGLNLPINDTLEASERRRFGKYVVGRGMNASFDAARFLNSCHNNARSTLGERATVATEVANTQAIALPDNQWTQGKDLVAAIAIIFHVTFLEANRLLHSAILACIETIRRMPSMAHADAVLRL